MAPDALTPFTESNLLLAAIREDWPEARRIARDMLPGERRSLGRTCDLIALLMEEYEVMSEPRILGPTDVCPTCANSGWIGSRSDPKPCRTCGRPTPTADELCPPGYWGWK